MKTRKGFVSNSSSSSFIVGLKKDTNKKTYFEKWDIPKLVEIKQNCFKMGIDIPRQILDIEEEFGGDIERIKPKDVYEVKRHEVKIPTIKHYEDFISFRVSDIPEGVEEIEVRFVND